MAVRLHHLGFLWHIHESFALHSNLFQLPIARRCKSPNLASHLPKTQAQQPDSPILASTENTVVWLHPHSANSFAPIPSERQLRFELFATSSTSTPKPARLPFAPTAFASMRFLPIPCSPQKQHPSDCPMRFSPATTLPADR